MVGGRGLQGSLESWFEILYELGVVQRMLAQDWEPVWERRQSLSEDFGKLIQSLNQLSITDQKRVLSQCPEWVQDLFALEVAYEYMVFQEREILH